MLPFHIDASETNSCLFFSATAVIFSSPYLGLPESSQLTFLTYIIVLFLGRKKRKVRRVRIGLTENFDDLKADQRGSLTRRGKTSAGLRHGGIGVIWLYAWQHFLSRNVPLLNPRLSALFLETDDNQLGRSVIFRQIQLK